MGHCQLQALLPRRLRNENGGQVRGVVRECQIRNEGAPQRLFGTLKYSTLFALFEPKRREVSSPNLSEADQIAAVTQIKEGFVVINGQIQEQIYQAIKK